MTKTRVYELAKELGVDNKVISTLAAELGLKGKNSHSSSLQAEEADAIRRALIRKAVGRDSETVTMRVDKTTGTQQAIVERRKGDVIRRRKQEVGTQAAAEEPTPVEAEPVTPIEESEPAPELPAETQEPALQEAAPAAAEEESAPQDGDTPAEAEVVEPAPEAPAEEAAAAPQAEAAPSGDEVEAAPAAEPAVPAKAPTKPTIGPKVLGRIELPQKKAPAAKAEVRRDGVVAVTKAPVEGEEEDEEGRRKGGKKPQARKKGLKREISRIDLIDYEGRDIRRAGKVGGKAKKTRDEAAESRQTQEVAKTKASKRVVKMADSITVGELAKQMSLKAGEVIAKLMELGMLTTINQSVDKDTAEIVAQEFEFQIESTGFDEAAALEDLSADDAVDQLPRPPVVTVMGHVDHGKTSLLDAIRKTSVAAKEAGGITQHIGAYSVKLEDNRQITFIDTPGHAAFTSMRARGAQVTDIVVLVVAADDGVMPQTIEAINHAKAAEVPMIVAINKIDKPEGNPDRIRQQLAEHGLNPEEWGGDTMFFRVSATKGQGIKELLEGILLLAEVKELRANPKRRARGVIIEARQDRGLGTVATVLVQSGTLKVGEVFVAGAEYGRVRSMVDHNGDKLTEAGPSMPVSLTGFSGVPLAGDDFQSVESEAVTKQVAAERAQRKLVREQRAAAGPISLEEFSKRANNMAAQELNVILKTDVHGSLEAVRDAIENLSTQKVRVRVIHSGVGGINESDVQLAVASRAIVIGFGVRAESRASAEAESVGVELRFYRIIYELIDDVRKAMAGLLAPIREEVHLGRVEVRDTFNVPKLGTIAGGYVSEGMVKRGAHIRLTRDAKVVHEGRMASLRRFKDDVREVQSGYECGIGIEGYSDVKVGDVLEIFEHREIAQSID